MDSLPDGHLPSQRPNTAPAFTVFDPTSLPLPSSPSPFDIEAWQLLLRRCPGGLAKLCCGILTHGCLVGCEDPPSPRPATNHPIERPNIITSKLIDDLALSRVQEYLEPAIISPLGLIPKHDGGWRRIHDLSWPSGNSTNDGIPETASAISYTSIDDIFDAVRRCGQGCFLIKRDIKDAFRNIPLAPSQRPLMAFAWEGSTYIECCLPFGLSTAPFLFNLFSEGIHWLLLALFSATSFAAELFHYLDDFITIIPRASLTLDVATANFNAIYQPLTDTLGVPRNDSKDAAGCCITILGIEIDSYLLEARLPQEKLARAQAAASSLLEPQRPRRRDLEATVGLLQHCAKVVRLGRARLQALYADLAASRSRFAQRRLSHSARADLRWWTETLPAFNGIHLFRTDRPAIALYTDACDTGLGIFFFHTSSLSHASDWRTAAQSLPSTQAAIINASDACEPHSHINVKEVVAVLYGFLLFGPHWAHHNVFVFTDNSAAHVGLSKQSLHGPAHKPLLKLLSFAASLDIEIHATWLPSAENALADALSRSNFAAIADLCPHWQNYSILNRPAGSLPTQSS